MISADAEASAFSEFCLFSLATLEVDCDPGSNNFALTERESPGLWRWAIISARGAILCAGNESTQTAAKQVASEALHEQSSAAGAHSA
jgi:hypothetical protein